MLRQPGEPGSLRNRRTKHRSRAGRCFDSARPRCGQTVHRRRRLTSLRPCPTRRGGRRAESQGRSPCVERGGAFHARALRIGCTRRLARLPHRPRQRRRHRRPSQRSARAARPDRHAGGLLRRRVLREGGLEADEDAAAPGTRVRLQPEPATHRVDGYGRLLRYVVRASDGMDVNIRLVAVGAAAPYFYDHRRGRYANLLERLAKRARAKRLGLWRPVLALATTPTEESRLGARLIPVYRCRTRGPGPP
jgi:Staphylococcal nuclease homologue